MCSEPEMCSVWRWESIRFPFPILPLVSFSFCAVRKKGEEGKGTKPGGVCYLCKKEPFRPIANLKSLG